MSEVSIDTPTLLGLKEGDLFEVGALLPALDGTEKLAWQVLENLWDTVKQVQRITLHGYYFDTYVMAAVVRVDPQGNQNWSFG